MGQNMDRHFHHHSQGRSLVLGRIGGRRVVAGLYSGGEEINLHYIMDKIAHISDGKIGPLTQKLYDTLTGIQWGKIEDTKGWTVPVE